jgi:type I restriction enzyme R subunit
VDQKVRSQPFLLSIGERAEELAQQYEDRHLTTQQALAEFEKLAQEYVEADSERQRLGLEVNAFAIYITLKPVLSTVTAQQATGIDTAFSRYPDYQWNEQQQKKLRAELYKILLPMVGAAQMVETTNSLLRLQRV